MTHRFAACFAIASLTFVAPRPAAAETITRTFETVEAVETHDGLWVTVTGILVGQTTPTTHSFVFHPYVDQAGRCERLAVIAMSKPGKYRFSIGWEPSSGGGGCKLSLRTP